MAKIITSFEDINNPVIRIESPYNLSKRELPKTNTIIVNSLIIVISQINNQINIEIKTYVAPLQDGSIPIIDFNNSEEIINFTEDGFRLQKLNSVIQKQSYQQFPHLFKSEDPDVIINNYSIEIRKDSETFPDFKNTLLDTLENVFNIEV